MALTELEQSIRSPSRTEKLELIRFISTETYRRMNPPANEDV